MSRKTQTPGRRQRSLVRRQQASIIALCLGSAAFAVFRWRGGTADSLLIAWNVAAVVFMALTWWRMLSASVADIRRRAAELDSSDALFLALAILAALASIAGIGLELHSVHDAPRDLALTRALGAVLTILISWGFLHTLFTVHYAHHFYAGKAPQSGLKFPDPIAEPLYWDFLYFAFTIGVAAQTADVAVTSSAMRKLTLLHALLSFLFNTTILALAVNVGASLL